MSYASVMGFRADIGLSLSQYSWLGSIVCKCTNRTSPTKTHLTTLVLGFLVGEYPMIWVMQKWSVTYVTGISIVLWGLCLTLMAVGKDFSHMMVLRL